MPKHPYQFEGGLVLCEYSPRFPDETHDYTWRDVCNIPRLARGWWDRPNRHYINTIIMCETPVRLKRRKKKVDEKDSGD